MQKKRSVLVVLLFTFVFMTVNLPVTVQADQQNISGVIQIVCSEEDQLINNAFTCLLSNGTVRYFPDDFGYYLQEPEELQNWTDIVSIAAGCDFVAGLKKDGTVVVEGDIPVESLKNIVSISAGSLYLYLVADDGTVYKGTPTLVLYGMDGYIGTEEAKLIKMDELSNVAYFAPAPQYSTGIAVHKDGTVTVVGDDDGEFSEASKWTNIKQASVGYNHAAAVKTDGTVVAVGSNENNQLDVSEWKDITKVVVSYYETIGLKKDGTLVIAGGELPEGFSGKKFIDIDSNGSIYKALTTEGNVLFSDSTSDSWQKFYSYAQNYGDPSAISSWAQESVQQAKERKIVTYDILSMYKKDITREEVCEIAVKLYEALTGKEIEATTDSPFTDTYNEEITKAYNLKIVSGIGNNQFGPDLKVTREQIAVMFYNTIKAAFPDQDFTPKTELNFSDTGNISSWAITQLTYMNEKGIITGVGGNMLSPKGNATREQAIVMINRVYDLFK